MSKKPIDDTVILPTGDIVKWNDWVPTEPRVPLQKPLEPTPEYDDLVQFFFPKSPAPSPGSFAEQYKAEGRCQICGELGRISMSVMVCSTHGPYT